MIIVEKKYVEILGNWDLSKWDFTTNAGVGKPSKVWIKYHAVPDEKNQLDGYRSGSKSMFILFMHVTYRLTFRQ